MMMLKKIDVKVTRDRVFVCSIAMNVGEMAMPHVGRREERQIIVRGIAASEYWG